MNGEDEPPKITGMWIEGNWLYDPNTGSWMHCFRLSEHIKPTNWYGPPTPRWHGEPPVTAEQKAAFDAIFPPLDEVARIIRQRRGAKT